MRKTRLIIIISFAFFSSIYSQKELFQKKEFIYKGDTLKYRVLFPDNYDKSQKYPLVLFLHGAGERGNDNEKQLVHGSAQFLDVQNRKQYPSIVIFPQCPDNEYWVNLNKQAKERISFLEAPEISKPLFLVKKLTDTYKKTEAVDEDRMYVIGLSMGGMGTFDLICRYPNYFAAAMPICGGVYEPRLKKATKIPMRIFHGTADDIVKVDLSKNAYQTLMTLGAKNVELILFEGVNHNSWDPAFAYNGFLSWMYNQTK